MSFGTLPLAPELQLRPRALKRAVNPSMVSGASGLNGGWLGGAEQQGAERADPSLYLRHRAQWQTQRSELYVELNKAL